MTGLEAVEVIDDLITETAALAQDAARGCSAFDRIGAGSGVGIRLKALTDAREALITAGLKAHERQGAVALHWPINAAPVWQWWT